MQRAATCLLEDYFASPSKYHHFEGQGPQTCQSAYSECSQVPWLSGNPVAGARACCKPAWHPSELLLAFYIKVISP
jgi:hypothetical protein